ncbi:Alginate biosynthesis sensor protein KinB [compost metagenome]
MLRRELIANLSHDLRTPLTTIRGHAYSLKQETLSDKGRTSIELIEHKISYLSQLIENLFSYSLLSSGKYPYHSESTDIVRLTRTVFANWYPVFEREQFTIDMELPEFSINWPLDPQWFERVLDNFLQNIMNHAASGRYVSVQISQVGEQTVLEIKDRGPGMEGETSGKGAGIGLSIVSLMLQEMKLGWDIQSDDQGTQIRIYS